MATAMFAQDGLTSKKGEAYLPEAGDWAIGFDANPFMTYAGQMFNGATSNSFGGATWQGNNPGMTLMGKYYKDETTAYRLMFRFGMGGSSSDFIQDTAATALPGTGAITHTTTNSNGLAFLVGGGIEKRKGNTRIQGYYGGMLNIGVIGGGSSEYEYGSTLDSTNVANGIIVDLATSTPGSSRTLESKAGGTFVIGLNGFIGVEWFVFPKVSVGAEYGWGFNMASVGEGETTMEAWNAADQAIDTYTTKTGGSGSWSFDTGVTGGNINILFHF